MQRPVKEKETVRTTNESAIRAAINKNAIRAAMLRHMPPDDAVAINAYFETLTRRTSKSGASGVDAIASDNETMYNVGDIVLVREDLVFGETIGGCVVSSYKTGSLGKVVRIKESLTWDRNKFRIKHYYESDRKDIDTDVLWSPGMFVGKIVPKEEYEVGDSVVIRGDIRIGETVYSTIAGERAFGFEYSEYCKELYAYRFGTVAEIYCKDSSDNSYQFDDSEKYGEGRDGLFDWWATSMFVGKLVKVQ